MAKVELRHLWKRYGDVVAVEDFSLAAEDGGLDSLWAYDHLLFRVAGEPGREARGPCK